MNPRGRLTAAWAAGVTLAVTLAMSGCGDVTAAQGTLTQPDVVLPDAPLSRGEAFPNGDPGDVMTAYLESVCGDTCAADRACGSGAERCVATCVGELVATPSLLGATVCRGAAACDQRAACAGAATSPQSACVELCGAIAACDAFPSDAFGPDTTPCALACTGAVAADAGYLETVACFANSFAEDCSRGYAGECAVDVGDDACADICVSLASEACQTIPGPTFSTLTACLSTCRAMDPVTQLQFQTCVGIACDTERCVPPDPAPVEACDTFCPAWIDACPGQGITDLVCDAICQGVHQAGPGFAIAEAARCIEDAAACPSNDALFLCLLPDDPRCDAICEVTVPCGVAEDDCQLFCARVSALDPDGMDDRVRCAEMATCTTIGTCFE